MPNCLRLREEDDPITMPNPSTVIGQPPDLAGLICEGLLCEGFVMGGELLASANVVFLRFEGIWHRLCIDCGGHILEGARTDA